MGRYKIPITERTTLEERLTMYLLSQRNPDSLKILSLLSDGKLRSSRDIAGTLALPLASTYRYLAAMQKEGLIYTGGRPVTQEGKRYDIFKLNEVVRANYGSFLKECVKYGVEGYTVLSLVPKPEPEVKKSAADKQLILAKEINSISEDERQILVKLSDKKKCGLKKLAEELGAYPSAVNNHLGWLLTKELVVRENIGHKYIYSINPSKSDSVRELLHSDLEEIIESQKPKEEPTRRGLNEIKSEISKLSPNLIEVFKIMLDGKSYSVKDFAQRIWSKAPELSYSSIFKMVASDMESFECSGLISKVNVLTDQPAYQISLRVMKQQDDYSKVILRGRTKKHTRRSRAESPKVRLLKALSDGKPQFGRELVQTADIDYCNIRNESKQLEAEGILIVESVPTHRTTGRRYMNSYKLNPEALDKFEDILSSVEASKNTSKKYKLLELMQDGQKHCAKELAVETKTNETAIYDYLNSLLEDGEIKLAGTFPRPAELYSTKRGPKNVRMYQLKQ